MLLKAIEFLFVYIFLFVIDFEQSRNGMGGKRFLWSRRDDLRPKLVLDESSSSVQFFEGKVPNALKSFFVSRRVLSKGISFILSIPIHRFIQFTCLPLLRINKCFYCLFSQLESFKSSLLPGCQFKKALHFIKKDRILCLMFRMVLHSVRTGAQIEMLIDSFKIAHLFFLFSKGVCVLLLRKTRFNPFKRLFVFSLVCVFVIISKAQQFQFIVGFLLIFLQHTLGLNKIYIHPDKGNT